MTPFTSGDLGYVSYQRGIIQGHFIHRYASRRAPVLCSSIVFRTVLSLDVNTQTVFLYFMSVKYTFGGYLWCFLLSMLRAGCYVQQMKSIQFFNPTSVIYIIAQVNCSTIANIWSKYPHYIMGYIINLGSMFFLLSVVVDLVYIDYSVCQIWSVYMQYMRRCDLSNNCLFLVIQQAEVLLNFLGECISIS